MGRREKPLETSIRAVLDLAGGLRQLRVAAGSPPYRILAGRAGYCQSALSQAASGSSLPSMEITLAYVAACGGDVEEWSRRWRSAAARLAGVAAAADPAAAIDTRSLANELTNLLYQAGFRRQRAAVAASSRDPATVLSRSTLSRAVGGVVPPTEDVLVRVLRLCRVPVEQHTAWLDARARIVSGSDLTGNVVQLEPIVQSRRSAHDAGVPDPAADLGHELRQLAQGRGLESAVLNVGPAIRELCDLDPDTPPHLLRSALITLLTPALRELPEDLRLVASAGLALHGDPEIRGARFLNQRILWCAIRIERDTRTVRRRLDEATYRLAQHLVADQATARTTYDAFRSQG